MTISTDKATENVFEGGMMDFKELCKARQEYGDKKYKLLVCPSCGVLREGRHIYPTSPKCWNETEEVNAAMYRNLWFDKAEEYGDVVNESKLQLEKGGLTSLEEIAVELDIEWSTLRGRVCLKLAETHGCDKIEVKRILP